MHRRKLLLGLPQSLSVCYHTFVPILLLYCALCIGTLMLSLLLTDWPPRGVRGGSGRLLLLGLLRVPLLNVPPLLGKVGWGLPDSLGGRVLDVGLYVVILEGPCDVLPVSDIGIAQHLDS